MEELTIEGWHKPEENQKSNAVGQFHFRVDEPARLRLEEAEEQLHNSEDTEVFVSVDLANLDLRTPDTIGELADCQLRVYLNPNDERGHFHLVGHRADDGSLVYTNSVMVDQLG